MPAPSDRLSTAENHLLIRTTSQWLSIQRCVPTRDSCHSNHDRVCFRLWFQKDGVHHGGKGPATVKESVEAGVGVGQSHFDSHTGSRSKAKPLKVHLQWWTSSSKAPPPESSMTTYLQTPQLWIKSPDTQAYDISPSNPHIIKAVGCYKENLMIRVESEEISLSFVIQVQDHLFTYLDYF